MKKILFTGGTGFLGRNLVPSLQEKYNVYAPKRNELNIKNTKEVEQYVKQGRFDAVIHAAIPNLLSNQEDIDGSIMNDSLKAFMNLYRLQEYYGKMLYFGSGAEFNKEYPIRLVKETMNEHPIPNSDYGLAKYVMNELANKSQNVYNLRIFGCYGPTDAHFKLITYAIRCCLNSEDISIKQNCIFDYMYVKDLIYVLDYFMNNVPQYHDYNVCTGTPVEIEKICLFVRERLHSSISIKKDRSGFNNEYSGNNDRIFREIPDLVFTSLEEGISQLIKYEKEVFENEKACS